MGEHLLVIISQERSMSDSDGFFKQYSRTIQERDLLLVHTGIRQPEFWYSLEEGLSCVRGLGGGAVSVSLTRVNLFACFH